jgi:hypothetical protein
LSAARIGELQQLVAKYEVTLKALLGAESVALISYCLGESYAKRLPGAGPRKC